MTEVIFGVSVDRLDTLARRIEAATDSYAKLSPIDEMGVEWGDRYPLLWELIRRGIYAAWDDPIIWSELSRAASLDEASAEDLVDFLSKVTTFDKENEPGGDEHYYEDEFYDGYDGYGDVSYHEPPFEAQRLAEFWPIDLDRMAMHAYAKDPDLVEARLADFFPDVRKGLDLVRRRFGAIEIADLPADTISSLAEVFVWRDLPSPVLELIDGEVVERYIGSHDDDSAQARETFLRNFSDAATWQEAVVASVFSRDDEWPYFRPVTVALPTISLDQLQNLLPNLSFYGHQLEKLYQLLLAREDDPKQVVQVAEELAKAGHPEQAEVLAVVATLRAIETDQSIEADALNIITLQTLSTASSREKPAGLSHLVDALQAFDEAAVTEHLLAIFDGPHTKSAPFPVLHAFPNNDALLTRAFAVARELAEGDYPSLAKMTPAVLGLSLYGEDLLPHLVQAADEADHPLLKATFHRAILGAVADGATHDDAHRFVSLIGLPSGIGREYDVHYQIAPDYRAALQQLGDKGLELALSDAQATDHAGWARIATALQVFPNEALADAIFDGVAAGESLVISDHDWFGDIRGMYYEHQALLKPRLGRALASNDDPDFHNQIRSTMGDQDYQQALDKAGAKTAADTTKASKVERLAKQYFKDNPDAPRTTVYIFERLDDEQPDPLLMNRIGGRPFGVTAEKWPCKSGDQDQPMTHIVTLDLETTPDLRQGLPESVRGISLFVRSPGMNSAWEPHNEDSFVGYVTHDSEEFQGELPAGDDNAVAFSIESIEVPMGLWSVEYDTDPPLEAVKKALYQCSAWGGGPEPIWLQGDEYYGNFLFQFDESFAYLNLGDCGIMFVFDDTAFWQCH